MVKHTTTGGKSPEDLDAAVRQIVSKAVASEQVIDLFAATGLNNPDLSILSDQFLEDVRGLPYRNLALEILQKLIKDEIKTRSRRNLVQSRSFAAMLECPFALTQPAQNPTPQRMSISASVKVVAHNCC